MLTTGALHGERVYLNAIGEDDVPKLVRWANSIDYARFISRSTPNFHTEKDMRNWVLESEDDRYPRPMAIRLIEDDTLIGSCGYKDIQWYAGNTLFWMGIGEAAQQGKGYGTDTVRIMLRYAFRELNMVRVGLEVADFNIGARRSYEKCGFKLEGTLRNYIYREGRYWDMHMMGILREEWEATQS